MIAHLKTPIIIERGVSSETIKGKPTRSPYEIYKYTSADVKIISGGLQTNDQYRGLVSTVYFTIRYDSNVDYNCQILWKDKIYKIDFIDETIKGFQKIITSIT